MPWRFSYIAASDCTIYLYSSNTSQAVEMQIFKKSVRKTALSSVTDNYPLYSNGILKGRQDVDHMTFIDHMTVTCIMEYIVPL